MEQRNEFLLQVAVYIDKEIAAADEVEPGERRIFDDVLLGKNQHVADAFMDPVGAAVGFGGEKAGQPFRRDVGGDAGRIETGPGRGDCLAVNIGGEHLHLVVLSESLQVFLEKDGEGICLLAGGTAGRPDADHRTCRLTLKNSGHDLLLEGLEGLRIPEEIGHADQQIAKQRLDLRRVLLQIIDIHLHRFYLKNGHAAGNAAVDGIELVLGKVVTGLTAQQDKDLPQGVLGLECRGGGRPGRPAEGLGHIGDELGGHLGRWKFVVDQTGGDGAARHAVVLG